MLYTELSLLFVFPIKLSRHPMVFNCIMLSHIRINGLFLLEAVEGILKIDSCEETQAGKIKNSNETGSRMNTKNR